MKMMLSAMLTLAMCTTACSSYAASNFSDPEVVAFVKCVEAHSDGPIGMCKIDKRKINNLGKNGESPLMSMLRGKKISPVAAGQLIKMGADPHQLFNPKTPIENTPMNYVIEDVLEVPKVPKEYLQAMIAAGAEVNHVTYPLSFTSYNPLLSAIRSHDYEKVKILIDAGANPNLTDGDNEEAILIADRAPDIQILLLKAGANLNAVDNNGFGICAYIGVHTRFEPQFIDKIKQRDVFIMMLRERGIRCVNVEGGYDFTPEEVAKLQSGKVTAEQLMRF